MQISLMTPDEIAKQIAQNVREKRLSLNISQKTLSQNSGISLGTLKKFEHSGKISLNSLLKIALILGNLDDFKNLFKADPLAAITNLDQIIKSNKKRQRGRK